MNSNPLTEMKNGLELSKILNVLRQLEALGENLEHSSIEILVKSKLSWILNKVNEQVRNCQRSFTLVDNKPTITKSGQKSTI
ncbi:hypothetical protein WUBG_07010 [Wuchereria bancrofti]|uniref:Uncharacterized protein n=1 Tax=Wuchereria bancrofti TaxID=6293 RepID=J9F427_WUCBA|nr:hypothetical protein WUBG_07010 [Wuchereria bancrofti]